MKNKKFWRLQNAVEGSDSRLYIDGVISEESWWGDEATPQQLRQELKEIKGDKLEVVINSPGGDVWAGVAMHDALKELDAEVTIKVSGLAASIASVIAMAGDKIVMTPGSTMMIHKASMLAWGNSDDMQKAIDMLKTAEEGIVAIYAERTGKPSEEINDMMEAETWMSAEKAVELGFADSVVKPAAAEEDEPTNLFAGNFAFSMKATKEAMDSYVSKVADEAETPQEVPVPPTEKEEDVNPKPEPVTSTPKEDEEKTEDVVATDTATEETIKPVENKETTMENETTTAVAQSQVIEPKNQAAVTEAPKVQAYADYLKSPKAVEDFANVLKEHAGVEDSSVIKDALREVAVKNGLTEADYFRLPDPVVTQIEDAVKTSGIFNALNHTGLDVIRVDWDDTDEDAETSRAGGHKKGTDKSEQVLDFDKRVIRAQYIYKYLTLNKEDVRENRSTGALIRFVMQELPTRVIREIERAVVIGDGRASNADRKINSFVAVKADAAANSGAGNAFATTYTPEAGESHYTTLVRAMDLLEAEGPVYLVSKKGYLTDLKLERDTNGALMFPAGSNVVDALGLAGNFEPTWFKDATDAANDAYLVVFSAYKTVGDNTVEAFTNFQLKANKHEYLQEVYKGGALAVPAAAVAIVKTPAVVEEG